MIIHSQIFDSRSKRSLADYTTSFQNNQSVNYDDLSQKCEDLFQKLTEFDLSSFPSLLEKSSDVVLFTFG